MSSTSSSNKKYNFTGKVALVTGSSSGIGAAIAEQFAKYGAHVAITGRNADSLNSVANAIESASGGVKPLVIVGDLLDDDFPKRLIQETVAKFGRLDFLVNNAGGTVPKGTLLNNPGLMDEFDQVLKLNLRAAVELTQLAVPHLEKSQGNIINISSVASTKPWTLPYSAAKAGLDMVTKTSALELGPKGVRVNSINPGPVKTALYRSMGLQKEMFDHYVAAASAAYLLKRIGEPEDIANLASFLASDDARNITGSIFFSDSGSMLYSPDLGKKE